VRVRPRDLGKRWIAEESSLQRSEGLFESFAEGLEASQVRAGVRLPRWVRLPGRLPLIIRGLTWAE
jgi:hypothetical protein